MATSVVCIASWNADLVSRIPRPLARGETLLADGFEISPGGKGSNAAVAAARQGAAVAVVARIGDDEFGRMALSLWHAEGIDVRHVDIAAGERSGVAQIHVFDDGDNAIAVFPGAGAGMNAVHARAAAGTMVECRVVMASCEVPLPCTLQAFRQARSLGALTLLNPAPAVPLPDELLPLVDVLTPNEGELMALADAGAATIDEAAALLLARGVGAIVVTLGSAGCRLYRRGEAPLNEPGHHGAVVDTIGAGDTFTGALAAALAHGELLHPAMRRANAAAALSVRGRGAIGGMPRPREVSALLADGAASSG
jgi:ribokinase